jgi:GT2 family glycosyltransferase
VKLSVIIVNYNVKYFIEQCLHSVFAALKNIEAEVIVVDNNSVDGSSAMIRSKFPQVILVENKVNVGFSIANNQAIRQSRAEYVLLLNPDTVVQEDTFSKCITFMDMHPEAGALGVKMIDGKGNFLPESKRALPTPIIAFYKIFGFSALFPKSTTFGRYHLGYLNNDQVHEIEILAGAYMFMRKETLDKTGLLDEAFFMYGEDIDLSYRIIKAGYKNYYYPDTTIIHYKGESTKKGSLNYVLVFYEAMLIFAQKHFSKNNFRFYSFLINLAIYLRAFLAIVKRFAKNTIVPIVDSGLIYTGYLFLMPLSESIKFDEGRHYPHIFTNFILPSYIVIWILSLLLSGAYDRPLKISKIMRGIGIGTLFILAIYALLPLEYRYSRILIVLGALWSSISLVGSRYFYHFLKFKNFNINKSSRKRILIIGELQETNRVKQLLMQTQIQPEIIGFVAENGDNRPDYIGRINQLKDLIIVYKAEELIFCAKDIPAQDIINHMLNLSNIEIEYKIAPPESFSIIGSNSINTAGDLYLINLNTISKPECKRVKRLFDLSSALILLIFYPILFFFIQHRMKALSNIFLILFGQKSWVGYYEHVQIEKDDLPIIKKGVFSPIDGIDSSTLPDELKLKLNFLYAKDYKFSNDFNILLRRLLYIGR